MFKKSPTPPRGWGPKERPEVEQKPTEETRAFQIPYGKVSKIALRIMPDRVLRTLFLYEPRSKSENRFVRIRLPDGILPDGDMIQAHLEGIVSQWALEDADAWLDLTPLQYAHDLADQGEGEQMDEVVDQPPPARQRPLRQQQPVERAEPAPRQTPSRPPPKSHNQWERKEQPARRAATPKQVEQEWRGELVDAGVGEFTDRTGRPFQSFAVSIVNDQGAEDTILGCDLERKLSQAGANLGDHLVIQLRARSGRKKLFHIEVID